MPIPVNFKGLAIIEYPDDWTEEMIREDARKNEREITAKITKALNEQAIAETAEDPENQPSGFLERLGDAAWGTLESAGRTIASIPKHAGRTMEILGPEAFSQDPNLGGSYIPPETQKLWDELHRQRAAEDPETMRERIEGNMLVKAGKALEETIQESVPSLPGRESRFWSGQVPQGLGTTVAGVAATLAGGPMAGAGMMFSAEAEDAWESELARQTEAGEPYNPDKALLKAFGYGAFASAVESGLGVGRLSRKLRQAFGGSTKEAVQKAAEGGKLGKFLADVVKEGAAGFTEEAVQRIGQGLIVSGELEIPEAVQEGTVGAVVQSGLGAPASAREAFRSRRAAPALPETARAVQETQARAGAAGVIKEPEPLTEADLAEIEGVEEAAAKQAAPDETKPAVPPLPVAEAGRASGNPEPEALPSLLEQIRLTEDPASSKAATLVTTGTEIPDFDSDVLLTVKTKHGIVIFNPDKIGPDEIQEAAKGDVFDGRVLGMADSGKKPTSSPVAVTTSTPAARNVVTELVEPTEEAIAKATEAQQAAVPGGTTEVKPAAQIIAERREDRAAESGTEAPSVPPASEPISETPQPATPQQAPAGVVEPAPGGVVAPPVTSSTDETGRPEPNPPGTPAAETQTGEGTAPRPEGAVQPVRPEPRDDGGKPGAKTEEPKRGKVGQMLQEGQVVLTKTGRKTTPFPALRWGSSRKGGNTVRRVDQWLMENAMLEAEALGDTFNARSFGTNANRPSQADKDSAEEYLFGDSPAIKPPTPLLKPITKGGDQSALQAKEGEQAPVAPAAPRPAPETTSTTPAPATAPAVDPKTKAAADLDSALADLADIFGTRLNIVPEERQRVFPVLVRAFDAAFRLGYYKFKDAARYILRLLRERGAENVANAITTNDLQGAYIAMSSAVGDQADAPQVVIGITKEEIEPPKNEKTGEPVKPPKADNENEAPRELPGKLEGEQSGTGEAVGGKRGTADATEGSRGEPSGSPGTGKADRPDAPESVGDPNLVRGVSVPPADNYRITDADYVGGGGLKQKFRDNIAAIRTLKKIEAEQREATAEEQAVLVKFVGWGAMGGAFGEVDSWSKEAAILLEVLTPQEYAEARRSTLDAFYTSPTVIRGIHGILTRFGFTGGKMVEGGVGVGHFIGLLPESWRANTSYIGVERDGLTARIASRLYPKSRIIHSPFEKADLARNSFDASTGNPPFGQQTLFDPNFREESTFSIHNFFLAKQISLLRPGGIGIWVVSHRFLDKLDPQAREWISKHADFLGAMRLPNNAFLSNAGTKVVTDIVVFRKRPEGGADLGNQEWQRTATIRDAATGKPITLNAYYAEHPEMILGTPSLGGKMYAREKDAEEFTVDPIPGKRLEDQIAEATKQFPEGLYTADVDAKTEALEHYEDSSVPADVPVGSFFEKDGEIRERTKDVNTVRTSKPVEMPFKNDPARVRELVKLRDALRKLAALERSNTSTEEEIEAARKVLNSVYEAFVGKFGPLNTIANRRVFSADPLSPRVFSLEREYDPGIGAEKAKKNGVAPRAPSAKKADIFSKRVVRPMAEVTSAPDAKSGLAVCLNQRGKVDVGYIAALTQSTPEQVATDLKGLIYRTPEGDWQTHEEYLSGEVREKLRAAEAAAKTDRQFQDNVEALRKVIPKDIPVSQIEIPFGAPWVGKDAVQQFLSELGGVVPDVVFYTEATGKWTVLYKQLSKGERIALNTKLGTRFMSFEDLVNAALNNKEIVVRIDDKIDAEESAKANQRVEEIILAWGKWTMRDPARREALGRLYNDLYNSYVQPRFDGTHLTLPGKSSGISLLTHQLRVAWRTITQRVVLYDHVVGAGKTFAGIAAFMEMRRLGIIRKPLFVVPNHLTTQWRDEWVRLYPAANILWASPSDFAKGKRERLFSNMANGDWDAVIIGHSSLRKLGMPPEAETDILKGMISEMEEAVKEARKATGDEKKDARFIKDMERRKEALEAKLEKAQARLANRDRSITFDELGIDGLFLDEAHEFKNLGYSTSQQPAPAGMGNPIGADKAFDLLVKLRWMQTQFGGKAPTVFATGTPISNSLLEVFHVMRYLLGERLKKLGIQTADAFMHTFGDVGMRDQIDASGTGFQIKRAFKGFVNGGELAAIYRSFADTITNRDLDAQYRAAHGGKPFPIPKIKGGKPVINVVPRTEAQAEYFGLPDENDDYPPGTILHRIDNLPDDPRIDNMLKITSDARKAGLDMRLVDPRYPDHPNSKVNFAVEQIVRVHRENDYRRGTQLVFCDLSIPSSARKGMIEQKAAEEGEVFWIQTDGNKLEEVPASESPKPFTFKNAPEGFSFFSRKMRDGYSITERSTGIQLASGRTLKEIKESLQVKFAQPGVLETFAERASKKAPPANVVSEFTARVLADRVEVEKETVEEDGDEGDLAPDESQESKLSFDEKEALNSDFSVYDDVRDKLIARGIPANQIAFIHDYNTPLRKMELYRRMNSGEVRILLGSTPKLGAGTNVQKRLVALHHLDAPWRPSDLEQREGRILRQGNDFYDPNNPDAFEVEIQRYASKQTYDARMWDIIEGKASGIDQFREADPTTRRIEEVSGEAANSAEMKAAASGNPKILEEIRLRAAIQKAEYKNRAAAQTRYDLENELRSGREQLPKAADEEVEKANKLEEIAAKHPAEPFVVKLRLPKDRVFTEFTTKDSAKDWLQPLFKNIQKHSGTHVLARMRFRGLDLVFETTWDRSFSDPTERAFLELSVKLPWSEWTTRLGDRWDFSKEQPSWSGMLQRINNFLEERPQFYRRQAEAFRAEATEKVSAATKALAELSDEIVDTAAMRKRHAELVAELKSAKQERKNRAQQSGGSQSGTRPGPKGPSLRASTAPGARAGQNQEADVAALQKVVDEVGIDADVVWEPGWHTFTPDGQRVPVAARPAAGGRRMQLNAAVMGGMTAKRVQEIAAHEAVHPELATAWGVAQLGLFDLSPAQVKELQARGYTQEPGESDADYAIRLKDEFVARQAEQKTPWWRALVDKIRVFLAKVGLAKRTPDEVAREILRGIARRQADRLAAPPSAPAPAVPRFATSPETPAAPIEPRPPRGTRAQLGKAPPKKDPVRSLPMTAAGVPIQPGGRRSPSTAEFGAPAYVRQKERERTIEAENFIALHGTLKDALGAINVIEDSALLAVTAGEIAARAAESLQDPAAIGATDPIDAARVVERAMALVQAIKTDTAQGMQAQVQVNARLGPFRAVLSYLELIRTQQQRVLGKKFPTVASDNIRDWMRESARKAVEAVARSMKSPDNVVTKALRRLAVEAEIPWAALFQSSWKTQRDVQVGLYKALRSNPDLAKLSKPEVLELTNLFVAAWAREHDAVFRREFARVLGESGVAEPDIARAVRALPRIIRWLNLGILDDQRFREAVAPEYGVGSLDDADVLRLGELAQEAQRTPDGVRRNKVYQQMLDVMVASRGISAYDLAKDFWYANILSGLRTWIDVGVGSWVSAFTMTARAAADMTIRGRPKTAYRLMATLIRSTGEGLANAADIIATGDTSRLPDTTQRMWDQLQGRGRLDTLEASKRHGSGWRRVIGQAAYVHRIMVALDYVGQLGARDAMLLYAANARNDLEAIAAAERRFDRAETDRARAQAQAELGTKAKKVDVMARQREILEEGIAQDIRDSATVLGKVAALNADPVGWGGIMYKGISHFPWVARTVLGWNFARAAINMAQNASDWLPGVGILNYARYQFAARDPEWFRNLPARHPFRLFGLDVPVERGRLIMAAQIGGFALTLAAMGIFLDDDDDDRPFEISGTWFGLTPQKKSQLMSTGERTLSIRVGDKWISYRNTPFASALAFVGNLRDKQRFRGDQFSEESAMLRVVNAWILGFFYIKDVSAMSQFSQLVGAAAVTTNDELEDANKKMASALGNALAGFFPGVSLMREIDTITHGEVYRPNGGMEAWLRNIPFARRAIGTGPAVNALGDDIEAPRMPWGRWISEQPDDAEWATVARLANRGVFLPIPGKTALIVGRDGVRRQMTAAEYAQYAREAGKLWREEIRSARDFLRSADADEARAWFERRSDRLHRRARSGIRVTE